MKSVADSWFFRRRDLLGAVCLLPLVGAVLFSRPWAPEGTWQNIGFAAIGWVFLALYLLLRVWATLYAGGRKDRILQTEGPYSITRNPLYLGSFFLGLAGCAFLQSLTLVAGLSLLMLLYGWGVVRAEEVMLRQLFPTAYPAYLQRTPRFFPRFALYQGGDKIEVSLPALRREV